MNSGHYAANEFYKLLKARNPIARQRWGEILVLAKQGDAEAIRAVLLMKSVMTGRRQVQVGADPIRPVVTPQQIEMLRQILISARNSGPAAKSPYSTPYRPVQQNPRVSTPIAQPPAAIGFSASSLYQVNKPEGIALFPTPSMNRAALQILPHGTVVHVLAMAENGYVQVDQPMPGFVCMTCAEVPGGPWLTQL